MAEILDNVHTRLIYFDNFIFRSMILLLKYERVVIVADWTIMSFPKFKKKVRRSRPRKRERSTRRSTWESGVRRCAISWSSPSISSHININHLILITVNVFINSSSAHRWQWWQWRWRKRRSDSRSFLQIKLARWSLKAGEFDQQRRIMKMLSSHSSLGRIEKSKNEICL